MSTTTVHPPAVIRFLTAAAAAHWGAAIGKVAIPLIAVTTLAADAGEVGLLSAASTVPFLLLGLPAGAWLDRVRRRPVMVAADLVRFALLAAVPVLHAAGLLSLPVLAVVTFLVGCCTVFFDLASQSHLPDLVGGRDLVRTNGRLATIIQSSVVAGPAVAGWLCARLEPTWVLLVTAAGYAWSAAWLSRIHPAEAPRPAVAHRHLGREVREGLSFVTRTSALRAVTIAGATVNFAVAGAMAMFPLVFLRDLGWSEADLGLFLGAGGVGGLAGAVCAEPLARVLGLGRGMLVIGVAVAPAALLVPMVGTRVPGPVAAVAWAAVIFKVGYDGVLAMSLRQIVTPSGLLGRVNGTMRVTFSTALTLGSLTVAVVGSATSPRTALAVCCAAFALVWVPLLWSDLPRVRSVDGAELSRTAG